MGAGRHGRSARAAGASFAAPVAITDPAERMQAFGAMVRRARDEAAVDVREVARKERTNVLAVVSKALAGYLNAYDRV